MTPEPSPEQRILGCSLSNFLADRRQQIVSEWMAMVIADKAVPAADDLTLAQLKDHIPQILDDLNRTLEDAFNQEFKQRASWRAASHAQLRLEQLYDISQVIREISDLRTTLIYHLAEFHDERIPSFSGHLGLFAMIVLHSFFDRVIRIAVEQFVSSSKLLP
jgi:hypothetical protein